MAATVAQGNTGDSGRGLSRRLFVPIILMVGSTAVALLLAEGLIRLVAPVPLIPQMYATDPHTIFRSKPNTREHSTLGEGVVWSWTTNSAGFRGTREYTMPKPAGTRRVVVLGDSFTFGFGVEDHQTYPAVLEQRLDSTCGGTDIEVVNAGVSGFSTSQELALLEHEGASLAPDAVVVGFFLNDPQDNIDKAVHSVAGDSILASPPRAATAYEGVGRAKAIANAIPGYEWLARHSMLINWLRRVYFASRSQDAAAHPPRWGMGEPSMTPVDSVAMSTQWRLVELLYRQIRDTTSAMGSELVVVLLPDDSTAARYVEGRPRAADTFRRMRDVCKRVGLVCVDVAETIGARLHRARISKLYLPREGHFSADGHRVTADALAPAVARALGCSHRGATREATQPNAARKLDRDAGVEVQR
jgi:lysophospholipase L1-like esterase